MLCLSGLCVKPAGAADGWPADGGGTAATDTGGTTTVTDSGRTTAGDGGADGSGGGTSSGGDDAGVDPQVSCPFKSYSGGASITAIAKGEEGAAAGLLATATFGKSGGMLSWGGKTCTAKAGSDVPAKWKLCDQNYECGGCKVALRRHDAKFAYFSVIIDKDDSKPDCKYGIYQMFDKAEFDDLNKCDVSAAVECTCVKDDYILVYHDGATVLLPIGTCSMDEVKAYTPKECERHYKCRFGGKDLACNVTLIRQGFGATATWRLSAYGKECVSKDATPLNSGPMTPNKCPDDSGLTKCAACAKACKGIPGCVCTKECEGPAVVYPKCSK